MNYEKPLPRPDAERKPFWDYCKQHELRVQRCTACNRLNIPSTFYCPNCFSDSFEWVKMCGRGKVYTYAVVRQPYHKAFAKDLPYVIASIELEEGPRMMSNIVGCKPEDIKINMPVEVLFEDVTDEFSLPKFKPA
jgi:uncharacterized OB-fold protein